MRTEVGIMNIMLVSVTERTKEIGLRLSVGASDVDVLLQFLVEAIVLSVSGGLIGIGLGSAAAATVGQVMEWPVAVTGSAVLLAFGFAVIVGVSLGFYPARKAAALNRSTRCATRVCLGRVCLRGPGPNATRYFPPDRGCAPTARAVPFSEPVES